MLTENEDAASKTVDARLLTDRHTHRYTDTQTDTQTDMTNFMIVAHRRWATIINAEDKYISLRECTYNFLKAKKPSVKYRWT